MAIDPSFLMHIAPVQVQDPLAAAAKGLSFADLMGKVQGQQLQLAQAQQLAQAYGDPDVMRGLSSYITGASAPSGGGAAPGSDPNAPPQPTMADWLTKVGP